MTPADLARLALARLMALIALCLAWELWLAPLLRPSGSWLALIADVPAAVCTGVWRA